MTSSDNVSNACLSNEDVHDKRNRKIISGESLLRRCRSEYKNVVHHPLSQGKPVLYAKSLMGLDDRYKAEKDVLCTGGESLTRRRTAVHKSNSMPHVNRLSLKRSSPKEWDEEPVTEGKRSLFADHSTEKMEVVYEEFITDSDAAVVNNDYSFNWGIAGSMQDLTAHASQSTDSLLDGIHLVDDPTTTNTLPYYDQYDQLQKSYQKWMNERDNNGNSNNNSNNNIDEDEKSIDDPYCQPDIGAYEKFENCASQLVEKSKNSAPQLVEERENSAQSLVEERENCVPRLAEETKSCAPILVEESENHAPTQEEGENCVPQLAEERGTKRMHSESIEDKITRGLAIFEQNLKVPENSESEFRFDKSNLPDVQHPSKSTENELSVTESSDQSKLKSSKSSKARISKDDDREMEESSRQPEPTENEVEMDTEVEMEQSTPLPEEAIARSREDDIPTPRSCFQSERQPADRSKEDEPPPKRSILQNIMQKFSNFTKPSTVKHVVFESTTNIWN